jgi:hypothetical protein
VLQTGQATRNILLNPADKKAKEYYEKAHDEFASTLEDLPRITIPYPAGHEKIIEARNAPGDYNG